MSATSYKTVGFMLFMMLVCTSSSQPSLEETLKGQAFQSVLDSLVKEGAANNSSTGNETSPTNPRIPGSLSSIIAFLASRGRRLNVDIGTGSSNNSTENSWALNISTSELLSRLLGSQENGSAETPANVTSDVGQTDSMETITTTTTPTSSATTTSSLSPAATTIQGTSGVPETPGPTETSHTIRLETSSAVHVPDWEVPHGNPIGAQDDPADGKAKQGNNPTIEQMEEPIEPSTDENVQQGSLPLVLGAAIVVIFGVGVAGAAVSTACRRRKMAAKDAVSESSSSSSFEVERGVDNPIFTSKSASKLILVNSPFPPNSRLYKDMRNPSPLY